MHLTLIILSLLISINVYAGTVISRIEAIDYPVAMTDDVLVFLSTGKVVKVAQGEHAILAKINKSLDTKEWLKITVNASRYIKDLNSLKEVPKTDVKSIRGVNTETYIPSVLKSEEWAMSYFKESRHKEKESQCFNRAHVWSYEWFKKHKFNSSKVFIFFTRKFIRKHNFIWWFHVAPYVHVNVKGKVRERVMDMKYTHKPSMLKDWIKRFIKTEAPSCLSVNTYSDYANYPENGNCYIMKASMYYYWPLDLENEELHGIIKTSWTDEELKNAYMEAFEISL